MTANMNGMSLIGCLAVLFICLGIPDYTYCQTPTRISLVDCPTGNECATKTHATCNATTQKCKCDAGFEEDSNGGSTCVAKQTKTRVSLVSCPTGNECGTHATCNATTQKCKCDAGFEEDSNGGSTCVAKRSGIQNSPTKPQVSTVVCSASGTECSAIPFAVCDTPTNRKCKCKDGYKEDSNGGITCIKVLGTQCSSGSSDCTGATNSACTGSKCTCNTGYNEKDNVCKKLLNTVTCSANGKECDTLDHAECDDKRKCTCSAGFTMNVDVCIAKNSGTTLTMKLGIFVLPVLVAIHAVFKW